MRRAKHRGPPEDGTPLPDVLGAVRGEPAFHEHHPPRADQVADCVHCGFCLTTCPTYVLWGQKMDSPRGRIHLMNEGLGGEPLTGAMVEHFDRCLGCMVCVTACPSEVRYDALIEATRAQVERRHTRTPRERVLRAAIFAVFPYPAGHGSCAGRSGRTRAAACSVWSRAAGFSSGSGRPWPPWSRSPRDCAAPRDRRGWCGPAGRAGPW